MAWLRRALPTVIWWTLWVGFGAQALAGPRLDAIRERGYLTCGVMPRVAGFASVDAAGRYSGFEVDICRALAAAILGAPDHVAFVELASVGQFIALNDVDVAARRLTWTMTREVDNGLLFGPVIFYDGAGFLVPAGRILQGPRALAGQPICVRGGSEAQEALYTYFPVAKIELIENPFESLPAAAAGFFAGKCAALAADVSELAAVRAARSSGHDDYVILPQMISKEPLALLLRQGDEQFFLAVRWTVFALIEAEELDVSSRNVETRLESGDPRIRWLLGPETGRALGFADNWVANVISGVGNYGEVFARHLGADSSIKLERGLNNLWTAGGLMYAPPVR